jgi:hypothetical protein
MYIVSCLHNECFSYCDLMMAIMSSEYLTLTVNMFGIFFILVVIKKTLILKAAATTVNENV